MIGARPTTPHANHPRGAAGAPAAAPIGPSPGLADWLEELRATVTCHVRERRAAGAPLERVLVEVGAMVGRAELAEAAPDELGILRGQVWQWSLDAYLDEPELRHAPRFH